MHTPTLHYFKLLQGSQYQCALVAKPICSHTIWSISTHICSVHHHVPSKLDTYIVAAIAPYFCTTKTCSIHSWWLIHFVNLQGQRWRWRSVASCHIMLGVLWPWPWGYLWCSVLQHSFSRGSWRKPFLRRARTLRVNGSHRTNGLCRLSEKLWTCGGTLTSSKIKLPG